MICDLFTDSQANSGAGVFCFAMQPLEDLEYSLAVLRLKPDTIIRKIDLVPGCSGFQVPFNFLFFVQL